MAALFLDAANTACPGRIGENENVASVVMCNKHITCYARPKGEVLEVPGSGPV